MKDRLYSLKSFSRPTSYTILCYQTAEKLEMEIGLSMINLEGTAYDGEETTAI